MLSSAVWDHVNVLEKLSWRTRWTWIEHTHRAKNVVSISTKCSRKNQKISVTMCTTVPIDPSEHSNKSLLPKAPNQVHISLAGLITVRQFYSTFVYLGNQDFQTSVSYFLNLKQIVYKIVQVNPREYSMNRSITDANNLFTRQWATGKSYTEQESCNLRG